MQSFSELCSRTSMKPEQEMLRNLAALKAMMDTLGYLNEA